MSKEYYLQSGKYGGGWYTEESYTTLEEALSDGQRADTYDGKFHYRITTPENGKVIWTKTPPYEPLTINTKEPGWLQQIAANYGLSKEDTFAEILHWLKIHTTPNGL